MAQRRTKKAKSKKQKQNKTKAPKNRKSRGPRQQYMGGMSLATKVCSNSNPFCPEANGAKIYDENSARSITWQHRSAIPISSSAAGLAVVVLSGGALTSYYSAATFGSGVVNTWSAGVSSTMYTTIGASSCDQYRIVSWGFKYKTSAPSQTTTGIVTITEIGADISTVVAVNGQDPLLLTQGNTCQMYTIRDADVFFIGRPLGAPSNEYVPIATAGSGHFTTCMLCFSGAPASTVLGNIELIVNYEWTAKIMTPMAVMSTKAAPSNPAILTARAHTFETAPVTGRVTTGHDRTWMSYAMSAVKNLGPMAIGAMFGPAAGAGAYAGANSTRMIMDAD